jgi:ribosomal protein S13
MFHHKNHHKENNLSELCSQIICEKVGFKKNSKVHELVTELKSSVNTLHEKFQHHLYQPKDVETSGKRKLLTPDPLTVALVHSTELNQIAFVLRDVLWVVCLN